MEKVETDTAIPWQRTSGFELAERRGWIPRTESASLQLVRWWDPAIALALGLWTALLNVPAIFALEFFRHTEADRTLIGWEMLERGDYVVPHLLGAPILTKPPFYYWLLAGTFAAANDTAEWFARAPSAVISVLFVVLQFYLLRMLGATRRYALTSALFLSVGGLFLELAAAAEIDMTFGFFCAISIYCSYLAHERDEIFLLPFGVLFALAFLTKGAPALAFILGPHLLYFLLKRRDPFTRRPVNPSRALQWHLIGFISLLAIAVPWFWRLALRDNAASFFDSQEIEVLHRFFVGDRLNRGPLFYVGGLFVSLLPWSVIPLALLARRLLGRRAADATSHERLVDDRFVRYNLLVVVFGMLLLIFAAGKANRYFFPLYAAMINLLALLWCRYISAQRAPRLLVAFLAAMFVFRVGESTVFASHRNATHSVKTAAAQVQAALPSGEPIYDFSLYQRWLSYYLRRLGTPSYRVTRDNIQNLRTGRQELYVLFDQTEDRTVIASLRRCDAGFRVLLNAPEHIDGVFLARVRANALRCLELRSEIS